MSASTPLLRQCAHAASRSFSRTPLRPRCAPAPALRPARRFYNPADQPGFTSVVDNPAVLVKTGQKHGPGLIILALIPITAFALGTWQVQRLTWKTELIARYEDRLTRDPLPLPPRIDPSAIPEFDYRRIYATGRLAHEREMLIGPRVREGEDGYIVVTPLEREGGSTVLVCRGWIARKFKEQGSRVQSLPRGEVTVEGLLRVPAIKNMFTPDNRPEKGAWYFPDVEEMAAWVGAEPVWIQETMEKNLIEEYRREEKGIPIATAAEVNLRNNHAQYIFTWYALGIATTVMLGMVLRKPAKSAKVRRNREW
ncbi:SURF1-domain-containing protein [Trichodelitschia bisporula]|uniref:SURF1-like protein n=1 Tax=Trichodelitschia bisporula TaxID=703511 RepID=A0A6G1HNL9_9PEZI|nr:SURF1-domain-containing protein [Trichodelitschia bisporula]